MPEDIPKPSQVPPLLFKVPGPLKVHQHKGQFFRVVHADGVWCSVNPWRNFHLTFYSERQPIPTSVVYNLNEKGIVTNEQYDKREVKEGMFRELEVDVVLSLDAARVVRNTLDLYIKDTEERMKSVKEQIK